MVESAFDLGQIVKNRQIYPTYIRERITVPAEPTSLAYAAWAQSVAPVAARDERNFWIVLDDKCGRLNKQVYRLLLPAAREPVPIGKILARCPEDIRPRVLTYLKDLESNGFVLFKDGDRVIGKRTPQGSQFRPLPRWKLPPIRKDRVKTATSEVHLA
jgi:hypothetical protein